MGYIKRIFIWHFVKSWTMNTNSLCVERAAEYWGMAVWHSDEVATDDAPTARRDWWCATACTMCLRLCESFFVRRRAGDAKWSLVPLCLNCAFRDGGQLYILQRFFVVDIQAELMVVVTDMLKINSSIYFVVSDIFSWLARKPSYRYSGHETTSLNYFLPVYPVWRLLCLQTYLRMQLVENIHKCIFLSFTIVVLFFSLFFEKKVHAWIWTVEQYCFLSMLQSWIYFNGVYL